MNLSIKILLAEYRLLVLQKQDLTNQIEIAKAEFYSFFQDNNLNSTIQPVEKIEQPKTNRNEINTLYWKQIAIQTHPDVSRNNLDLYMKANSYQQQNDTLGLLCVLEQLNLEPEMAPNIEYLTELLDLHRSDKILLENSYFLKWQIMSIAEKSNMLLSF